MQPVYNIFKTEDNKVLIEINRGQFEGRVYVLFVSNEAPYPTYIAEVVAENKFEFVKDKSLAIRVLKELSKDEETANKLKPLK